MFLAEIQGVCEICKLFPVRYIWQPSAAILVIWVRVLCGWFNLNELSPHKSPALTCDLKWNSFSIKKVNISKYKLQTTFCLMWLYFLSIAFSLSHLYAFLSALTLFLSLSPLIRSSVSPSLPPPHFCLPFFVALLSPPVFFSSLPLQFFGVIISWLYITRVEDAISEFGNYMDGLLSSSADKRAAKRHGRVAKWFKCMPDFDWWGSCSQHVDLWNIFSIRQSAETHSVIVDRIYKWEIKDNLCVLNDTVPQNASGINRSIHSFHCCCDFYLVSTRRRSSSSAAKHRKTDEPVMNGGSKKTSRDSSLSSGRLFSLFAGCRSHWNPSLKLWFLWSHFEVNISILSKVFGQNLIWKLSYYVSIW